MMYTTVDEGYCVTVFRSVSSIADCHPDKFLDGECTVPVTRSSLRKELRNNYGPVYMWNDPESDWIYNIEKH